MTRVLLDEIEEKTRIALESHGAAHDVAASVAHAVRVAENNGNRICGLYYLESYCQQLKTGRVLGAVAPMVHIERPGAVRVDGKMGFALFPIGWQQQVKKIAYLAEERRKTRIVGDVFYNLDIATIGGAQVSVPVGIAQKPDIKDQIRTSRQTALIGKTFNRNRQTLRVTGGKHTLDLGA